MTDNNAVSKNIARRGGGPLQMPTLRWFVTAAILTLLVAFAVIAAFLPIDEWNQWHRFPELGIKNYGEYGGWLQGVLTRLILLVAFVAWFSQKQSAKEANTIQARSFLLEFLHNLLRTHKLHCRVRNSWASAV